MKKANRPIAVLISDVHYNINTLEVADKAVRMAVAKSNELSVPLIVCGDLHDTKANLRGECMNAMIKTFNTVRECYILRGNHDSLNEKSEEHSLGFLDPLGDRVIDKFYMPWMNKDGPNLYMIPYYHDAEKLRLDLKKIQKPAIVIMHQGVQQTNAGHYIQDKSALTKQDLAGLRVISGHYHTRQSFALPDGGKFDYVGNPYTLNFAEASDPEKGFQVLYSDGSLEFIPTNLREHRVVTCGWDDTHGILWGPIKAIKPTDILKLVLEGTADKLAVYTKDRLAKELGITNTFRLELKLTALSTTAPELDGLKPEVVIFDDLIDSLTETTAKRKERLKVLWKEFK